MKANKLLQQSNGTLPLNEKWRVDFVQNIVEFLPARVYWKDLDGRYLGCNAIHAKMLGLTSSKDIIGKTDFELPWAEGTVAKFRENDLEVITTRETKFCTEKLNINNQEVFVLSKRSPVINTMGVIIGVIVVCFDYSEKEYSLNKVSYISKDGQNDELTLQNIIDNFPGHVYWKDRDGRYLGTNIEQVKNLGLDSVADMIGKTDFELPWEGGSAAQFRENDLEVMRTDRKKSVEEYTQMKGKPVVVLSNKSALKNNLGEIVGVIGVSLDITDTKEKERLLLENKASKIKALQLQATINEQERFKKIVQQVMHDITSPVTSINNIVSKLNSGVSEDDRVTLRNAADRIAGISQKLLSNYNDENLESENENFLVSLALLQIINEKREEYFDRNIIFDVDIDEEVKFICIKQNIGMFKRMISNLVNNSVEALNNKPDGKIAIILGENVNELVIIVEDNGGGMPQHIQDKFKLGIGITEGKENGHGVGLTQVRDAIATGHGTYRIAANNKGTTITIWFPQVATPSWLATEIKLLLEDTVIILDDDESIHGSWDKSFANILEKYPTLKILHFTYGHEVVAYINNLTTEQKQNIFLLTDFELLEQGLNGLDVVKQTNMRRAILVTSYSSNPERQMEVSKLGIKMLPKELAASAKISVDKRIPKWSSTVDMVWVEDQIWLLDDLVKRHYNHLKVDKYYDPISFMEDVHQYPLDTRIILDTYYISPDGVQYDATGYDLARELHTKGYTKLIIFTGEGIKDHAPEYLTVARKASSYDTENLDKL